jgi:hypothetical protein
MKILNSQSFTDQVAVAFMVAIGVTAAVANTGCAADPGGGAGAMVTVLEEDKIDDLEDGNQSILAKGFRQGDWYVFADETPGGMLNPAMNTFAVEPAGADTPLGSARMRGSGFTEWGAGLGFDLNSVYDDITATEIRKTYDVTPFMGVAFKAKGNTRIRFAASTVPTETVEFGGTCVNPAVGEKTCNDTHGTWITVSPEWKSFAIPFSKLTQQGFGPRVEFKHIEVMAIHFQVMEGVNFDISIDDVGFYK